ncbi:FAD-dependent oxidoreductase [Arcobacter sp. LA11]|uniref:FAD-dependent oxidoreductase n=1 Tax=Arcobacter sp. LA11 TaxID=1898176 RepID=UPI000932E59E|nr:FCSD flavin-binding domain-containing protein [Arcobacter sp. LA11]
MKRREFIKYSAISAALLNSTDSVAKGKFECQYNPENDLINKTTNIAVCGGGYAGLSIAKFLKELNPKLEVTVIEQKQNFISCPYSNLWLGGIPYVSFEDLNFDYFGAVNKYKYSFVNEKIVKINRDEKLIYTTKTKVKYDYMIMACGIDYDYTKLYDSDISKAQKSRQKTPAGLKPGSEHLALKRMIKNFKGGDFIISIPSSSYRCPPAPYERACMIANYFKQNNIDGRVVILDPRKKPAAKASKFLKAFNKYYSDFIDYRSLTNFKDIDFDKKTIFVESFDKKELKYKTLEVKYEEASIIPPNKANSLVNIANLELYENAWAKLRKPTFRSTSDEDVYVIGDAQGEYPYPKSAYMANSCAYIVAKEIVARYKNETFDYKKNMPSNICYSMVTNKDAVFVSHTYKYKDNVKVNSYLSPINEDAAKATKLWYKNFTKDIFGLL